MGFRLGLRLGFRRILLALAAASYCVTAQAAPAQIDIPADGTALHATLYRPDGDGPFPAVVALHDCDGLSGRQATQAQLYTEWANILVAKGFVVLFPDSFSSRGVGSQCRESERKVHARRERVARRQCGAALAANSGLCEGRPHFAARLVERRFRGRCGRCDRPPSRKMPPPISDPQSRCIRAVVDSVRPPGARGVPTLILIGSADDWTPATTCQQMVAGARGRTARAEIIVYPGAYREFDRANLPVRVRTGLVNTADPAGKAHGGTNPAARNDAIKRVPEWLAR
jgi:dienelactone hydrolase